MGTHEQELEKMELLADAMNNVFGRLLNSYNDEKALLRKIHSRATGDDPLQEGYQTRLDPDILEELETLLSLTNDSEETRPD